ncbi:iron-containing alcohol dehydrogenase [Bacillus sp. ISL-7]|uniref:iron-containing alcohol dehydrogenase n=1 Tax=Bacillus sp. ISL-7 TaxID=2819136 RepID=UPI001BEAA1ED|nr:iron-containing alcohol dehydrogenase [Bacillus sp. ISL-7]MBT2734047.1 iron-containing alcohol dehydrogenase [Bacillus sp. ISL-7]
MKGFAEFRIPKTVFYGNDSLTKLGEQAALLGKKVLIVSDKIMTQIGVVAKCQKYLEDAGIAYACYLEVNSEPTDIYVSEALTICKEQQCDVVVAVGGGSCIDAAKAVAVVAANGGYIGDYMGGKKKIENKPLPLIAIPTTSGTGSEVTAVTVINNTKDDVKMMIKDPAFIPEVAIVDPVLTYSTPPQVTAATGIDALCHAMEAYISRVSQPITDQLALSSIEMIVNNLRAAYQNGNDVKAREKMALASMQAGIAFSNASVTLVHGMSRPIGALFHVPHGISNAMLLPAVLEFTKESAVERLAVIGRILRPDLEAFTDHQLADVTVNEVKKLCNDLNIPNMKAYGMDEEMFNQVVSKMAADAVASGSPSNNPRVPSQEEIVELYHTCYNYDFTVNKTTIHA